MRVLLLALLLTGCAAPGGPAAPAEAREQLALAERAWLDAYDANDREATAEALAEGFTIVSPDGRWRVAASHLSAAG